MKLINFLLYFEIENSTKLNQEFLVQELLVYLSLHMFWNLTKNFFADLIIYKHVFIILPFVLEIFNDLLIKGQALTIVKLSYQH